MPALLVLATLLGIGAVLPRGGCGDGGASGVRVERWQGHMGTTLRVRVCAVDRGAALAASESAFAAVRDVDGLVSTWRASELGRLNGAPAGAAVALSAELGAILEAVFELSRATGGAFDPAIGSLIDVWGLRGAGRRPAAAELAAALSSTGLAGVELDVARATATRLREGVWLDAGGFGKGAALDAAAAALARSGVETAVLNFGGQVQVMGGAVPVPVASPEARGEPAALLRVGAAAATTSSSERLRVVDGQVAGHVLDPRTGVPVEPWGSVTVVAGDGLTADALSTGLFVLGPEEALAWAAEREAAVLVLVASDGGIQARWSEALEPRLICLADGVEASAVAPRYGAGRGSAYYREEPMRRESPATGGGRP